MTLLKIYALEDTKEEDVVSSLPEGEHVIGRGVILNCNDKRISRKHALINVSRDMVTIKAVHVNPCFFKAANGNSITILPKNTSVKLNDCDQFALLADLFWFRVRVLMDNEGDVQGSENILLSSKTATVNSNNSTVTSPKSEMPSVKEFAGNNVFSKRFLEENFTETCKRQKTSDENKNEEPSTSTSPDKNSSSKGEASNRLTSPDSLDLLLDTTPNLEQNINSNRLINNLNNILEEDYGDNSEKTKQKEKVDKNESDYLKVVTSFNNDAQVNEEILNENIAVDSAVREGKPSSSKMEEKEGREGKLNDEKVSEDVSNNMAQINEERMNEQVKVKKENVSDSENEEMDSNKGEVSNSNVLQLDKIKNEIKKEEGASTLQSNEDKDRDSENKNRTNDQNEASCSTDNQNKKKSRRERCWYAHVCYRKNPLHRENFSHPGDDDFLSDPDDDRPDCPFGDACYRSSLIHRREYKHASRPAPKPNDGNENPKRKRKSPKKKTKTDGDSDDDPDDNIGNNDGTRAKRKAALKKLYTNNYGSDDDDYDYDDPFIDDASSDEFQLSDDDEDSTDWEDSQKVNEESQDTRRLLKEAKRFTKAKPKKKD